MKKTTEGITVISAVVALALSFALSWIALFAWRSSGREYPLVPWFGLVPMALYAVMVLFAAWKVRQYVRSTLTSTPSVASTFMPTPQQARGTLVAAQAGALGGAMLVGFYAANAIVHLTTLDVESVRAMFIRAVISLLAAAGVSAAGFAAQWMCRLPPDDRDDELGRRPDDDAAYG